MRIWAENGRAVSIGKNNMWIFFKSASCEVCKAAIAVMGPMEDEPLIKEFKEKHRHEEKKEDINDFEAHLVDA